MAAAERPPGSASPAQTATPPSDQSTDSTPTLGTRTGDNTPTPPNSRPSDDKSLPPLSPPTANGGAALPALGLTFSNQCAVQFRPPRDPNLPQGRPRARSGGGRRMPSPKPVKFRQHVCFDNLSSGDSTKHNTLSYSLQTRHDGYHPARRSRTFMVGVDQKSYSDYALVWLLTNMVDDGDQVIVVHVAETFSRAGLSYQEEAKRMLAAVQGKNELNKAISITLEYAFGRLHQTFQKMIHIYEPSLLVVGTKGRSLGGLQGLVNKNSFSKYCLQYSPVPVVVVRPDDKRTRKKEKRLKDPARQSYAAMLLGNQGRHESAESSTSSSVYELEKSLSADEEAHRVAAAIGLPAAFDPTLKPYHDPNRPASKRYSAQPTWPASPASPLLSSPLPAAAAVVVVTESSVSLPSGPSSRLQAAAAVVSGEHARGEEARGEEARGGEARGEEARGEEARGKEASGDEDSGEYEDSDEFEFEVVSGAQLRARDRRKKKKEQQLLKQERLKTAEQKEKLHAMEKGEAAALLKSGKAGAVVDEDDEEEEGGGGGQKATNKPPQ